MENGSKIMNVGDPALLARIASGDEAAFRQVYVFYYKRLCLFAYALVKTREPAEEIVEDVFVRIWQQRETIPSIQNIRVYLYTAIKNSALNYLSQKARQSITEPFDHIHIGVESPTATAGPVEQRYRLRPSLTGFCRLCADGSGSPIRTVRVLSPMAPNCSCLSRSRVTTGLKQYRNKRPCTGL